MTKDAYWFQHDANARNDPKMIRLRRLHGHGGVGVFWYVVEMLREADGYKLPTDAIDDIAYDAQFSADIIESLFDIGLLFRDGDFFWSEALLNRMRVHDEKKKKRSDAGKLGGRPRKKTESKPKAMLKQCLSDDKANRKQSLSKPKAITEQNRTEQNRTEQNRTRQDKTKRKDGYSSKFEHFWENYPKKIGKGQAARAYDAAKKRGMPGNDVLIAAIEKQKASQQWTKNGGEFIPHASTWLNGDRWEDDTAIEVKQASGITYGMRGDD